jgi:hypothetical protein
MQKRITLIAIAVQKWMVKGEMHNG